MLPVPASLPPLLPPSRRLARPRPESYARHRRGATASCPCAGPLAGPPDGPLRRWRPVCHSTRGLYGGAKCMSTLFWYYNPLIARMPQILCPQAPGIPRPEYLTTTEVWRRLLRDRAAHARYSARIMVRSANHRRRSLLAPPAAAMLFCIPLLRERASYNGSIEASQASDTGSIPVARSITRSRRPDRPCAATLPVFSPRRGRFWTRAGLRCVWTEMLREQTYVVARLET